MSPECPLPRRVGARVDLADLAGPARARSLALPSSSCFCAHQLARIAHPFRRLPRRASKRAVAHACGELPRAHAASEILLLPRNPVATFPSESNPRGGWDKGAASALGLSPFLRMRSNIRVRAVIDDHDRDRDRPCARDNDKRD